MNKFIHKQVVFWPQAPSYYRILLSIRRTLFSSLDFTEFKIHTFTFEESLLPVIGVP